MKAKELKNKSKTELEAKLFELKSELARERALAQGMKNEKPGKIKLIRKDVARVLTLINAKTGGK